MYSDQLKLSCTDVINKEHLTFITCIRNIHHWEEAGNIITKQILPTKLSICYLYDYLSPHCRAAVADSLPMLSTFRALYKMINSLALKPEIMG